MLIAAAHGKGAARRLPGTPLNREFAAARPADTSQTKKDTPKGVPLLLPQLQGSLFCGNATRRKPCHRQGFLDGAFEPCGHFTNEKKTHPKVCPSSCRSYRARFSAETPRAGNPATGRASWTALSSPVDTSQTKKRHTQRCVFFRLVEVTGLEPVTLCL